MAGRLEKETGVGKARPDKPRPDGIKTESVDGDDSRSELP
jgi:hypothetical protein